MAVSDHTGDHDRVVAPDASLTRAHEQQNRGPYDVAMDDSRQRVGPPSRWGSWLRAATAACTLAVLATACIQVEMGFVVRDDGSGSMAATMRIDAAILGLAGLDEDGSIDELCDEALDDMDGDDALGLGIGSLDASAEAAVMDGECVVTTTAEWSAEESGDVLAALAEDDGPRIRRLGDGGWRFEMDTDSDALVDEATTPDDIDAAAALGIDFPSLAISVTLPGDAVEHNADSVSQSTYSWEIDFAADTAVPEVLYAETAASGGLSSAAIGAIVAGVLLALAALVTLRRHQEAKHAEAAAADTDAVESGGASP